MFISFYHLDDLERHDARREHVTGPSAVVGADPSCDVVLGDPDVAGRHLRVTLATEIVVEQLGSDALTLVDGKAIHAPTAITERSEIQIGRTMLRVYVRRAPWVTTRAHFSGERRILPSDARLTTDPDELQLIAMIQRQPDDEDARMVYADWLEERGHHAQASFVRADVGLTTHRDQLLTHVPDAWRAVMARAALECAHNPLYACPGRWERLAPTASINVRHCRVCQLDVLYRVSTNSDEARRDIIEVMRPRADYYESHDFVPLSNPPGRRREPPPPPPKRIADDDADANDSITWRPQFDPSFTPPMPSNPPFPSNPPRPPGSWKPPPPPQRVADDNVHDAITLNNEVDDET